MSESNKIFTAIAYAKLSRHSMFSDIADLEQAMMDHIIASGSMVKQLFNDVPDLEQAMMDHIIKNNSPIKCNMSLAGTRLIGIFDIENNKIDTK